MITLSLVQLNTDGTSSKGSRDFDTFDDAIDAAQTAVEANVGEVKNSTARKSILVVQGKKATVALTFTKDGKAQKLPEKLRDGNIPEGSWIADDSDDDEDWDDEDEAVEEDDGFNWGD